MTSHLTQQNVELQENQFVARIVSSRGNNLHEVITAEEEQFLVTMPTKFRKTLWVKRGNYLILQPIEEGDKVRAEIVHVLDAENIAFLLGKEQWPNKFVSDAEQLTSRRGALKEDEDPDMYPPSSSESEVDESEDASDEEQELWNVTLLFDSTYVKIIIITLHIHYTDVFSISHELLLYCWYASEF